MNDYTPWRATKFYIPLALQAASQSLTYPLVASIVSHGSNGVQELAAFAQGQIMMFVIGSFGGGLITTGMVFGRDKLGYQTFKRLNMLFTGVLCVLQCIVCIPAISTLIFEQLIGLTPDLARIARNVLFISIPVQYLFFIRNAPIVALYNARASAAANWATVARIALTGAIVPLFIKMQWVGYAMGIVATTLPVLLETVLAYWLARPYVAALQTTTHPSASLKTQFTFTVPISFGGVLLSISSFMVGAFIARAADPLRMLPIHYVTMGVINPVSFAALRIQAVVISFASEVDRNAHAVLRFALIAGSILAIFPLAIQIPCIADWYFGSIQNLPRIDIPLAVQSAAAVSILPILQTIRGHAEGLAAYRKRPNAILAGQAVFMGMLICTLFIGLSLNLPGNLIGVVALLVAVLFTAITIRLGLVWAEMEDQLDKPNNERFPEGYR